MREAIFYKLVLTGTSLAAVASVCCFTYNVKKNLKLCSKFSARNENASITIESLPAILKDDEFKRKRDNARLIGNNGLWKNVRCFIDTFDDAEGLDISTFYSSLSDVKFVLDNSKTKKSDKILDEDKVIYLKSSDLDRNMIKSLLGLASTRTHESVVASGFERSKLDVENPEIEEKIGSGLNTGYKEVLLARFYNEEAPDTVECDIASFIESIIGRKTMEQMFFDGALDELVDNLGKYSSRDSAIRTIREFDLVYEAIYGTKSNIVKYFSRYFYKNMIGNLVEMMRSKLVMLNQKISDRDIPRDEHFQLRREFIDNEIALSKLVKSTYSSGMVDFLPRNSDKEIAESPVSIGSGFKN